MQPSLLDVLAPVLPAAAGAERWLTAAAVSGPLHAAAAVLPVLPHEPAG